MYTLESKRMLYRLPQKNHFKKDGKYVTSIQYRITKKEYNKL